MRVKVKINKYVVWIIFAQRRFVLKTFSSFLNRWRTQPPVPPVVARTHCARNFHAQEVMCIHTSYTSKQIDTYLCMCACVISFLGWDDKLQSFQGLCRQKIVYYMTRLKYSHRPLFIYETSTFAVVGWVEFFRSFLTEYLHIQWSLSSQVFLPKCIN